MRARWFKPHWTIRYAAARLAEMAYRRLYPRRPWLVPRAIDLIDGYLRPGFAGLECGSGRSTEWLAARLARLTSLEHDPGWYAQVRARLERSGQAHVRYVFRAMDVPESRGEDSAYVAEVSALEPRSLDFALVDGVYRADCALAAIDRLKPGGWLVIDNVNWFLPSNTRSPSSRGPSQGPSDSKWERFEAAAREWDRVWTSNGVTDTAIFVKPGGAS